jgi:hypothetical protein
MSLAQWPVSMMFGIEIELRAEAGVGMGDDSMNHERRTPFGPQNPCSADR